MDRIFSIAYSRLTSRVVLSSITGAPSLSSLPYSFVVENPMLLFVGMGKEGGGKRGGALMLEWWRREREREVREWMNGICRVSMRSGLWCTYTHMRELRLVG